MLLRLHESTAIFFYVYLSLSDNQMSNTVFLDRNKIYNGRCFECHVLSKCKWDILSIVYQSKKGIVA